ncbi:hypothetical protein GW915_03865 [bacterium]|nr:hypothetical protein [bacterium]
MKKLAILLVSYVVFLIALLLVPSSGAQGLLLVADDISQMRVSNSLKEQMPKLHAALEAAGLSNAEQIASQVPSAKLYKKMFMLNGKQNLVIFREVNGDYLNLRIGSRHFKAPLELFGLGSREELIVQRRMALGLKASNGFFSRSVVGEQAAR